MIRRRDDHEDEKTTMLLLPPLKHADVIVEHELTQGVSATNDHKKIVRSGTLWSTVAHIITAVIGSGVLSLAWSVSQLDCYRSPDPVTGTRNRTYIDAVKVILGEKQARLCGLLQFLNFFGTGVAYVVTTSTCMREGHDASCEYPGNLYMLLFGAIQIVMSQIPDIHSMVWLSVVAAVMSFCYSSIGLELGVAKVIENGRIYGCIKGVPTVSLPVKLWLTFQALGDIAFAYPNSITLLEIQDTVKSPPSENKIMKKASVIAITVTTFFYLGCGCFGYATFGNDTPGNLLTGFGFHEPYWLIDIANACIILHLVGGYQLYSQPVFAYAERWLTEKFPDSAFLTKMYYLKLPICPDFQLNLFRLSLRAAYVVSTTGVAVVFPYFNEILGLLGALNTWPIAIYYPVEMYKKQRQVKPWSLKWAVLQIFSSLLMVVSTLALTGSIAGVIEAKIS